MGNQTEGNTYVAHWRKRGRFYLAWLERRPTHEVRGDTEDELKEQLWELAMEFYGDGEACIELVPPLPPPKHSANYFDPAWFRLNSNEGLRHVGDRAALFRGGLCAFCRAGLGGRTEEPHRLDGVPRSDYSFLWSSNPHIQIVTSAFLEFFGPLLRERCRTIPVVLPRKGKKSFWELVLDPTLESVCHISGTHHEGVVCPTCQTARFGAFVCERVGKGMQHAVAREAIVSAEPADPECAHVLRSGAWNDIVVNAKVAAELKQAALRGVLLDRLALLPPAEIGPFAIRRLKKSEV